MTYVDYNFYKKDKHKYQLASNEEFLRWYLISLEGGIKCDYDLKFDDYELLIDTLTNWYNLRYPDYILKPYTYNPEGERLSHVKDISKELDTTQLLARLPYRQLWLMDCDYGMNGNSSGNYTVVENGREVSKGYVGLRIHDRKDRRQSYNIAFDPTTGVVISGEFTNYYLEDVLEMLDNNNNLTIDYSELQKTVEKHQFDMELRHRLLQLTALKIFYSGNTPEMGYKRAVNFIEDMNQELGLLLTTDEIDELYNNYQKEVEVFNNNPRRYYRQYVKRLRTN